MACGLSDTAALDAAISNTAASEFARITTGLGRNEKATLVSQALDSLHGSIPRLEMPEYTAELVALFYSVWYQPFQVNSAFSLISRIIEERQHTLAEKRRLDIVDFGSGALAMEFGLALAVLDAQERGAAVPDTNVYLIEPSDAMTRTGFSLWQRFITATGEDVAVDVASGSATKSLGASSMRLCCIADLSDIETSCDADRWLVSMHAYYREGAESIRRDLKEIHDRFEPQLGIMTFHHANRDGIDYVSPFAGSGTPIEIGPLRLSGELPLVNGWRRSLADELGLKNDTRLTRPVEWDPARGLRDNRATIFRRE